MKSYNSYEQLLTRRDLMSEIDTELAARRFREFVPRAWSIVEPATTFVPGWHIDAICEHLDAVSRGQIRRLLVCMPPRHMKSLLVAVLWPCWEWINNPARRWLYCSYAGSLAVRDSVKCRRLLESPWYRQRWGDRFVLTSDQNEKSKFENDRSGYRMALGVGGAATGEGGAEGGTRRRAHTREERA
jgi:hypothetical protein